MKAHAVNLARAQNRHSGVLLAGIQAFTTTTLDPGQKLAGVTY